MRCAATTKAGKRCTLRALRNTRRCLMHSPGGPQELGRRGGLRRRIFDPSELAVLATPENAIQLAKFVAVTMVETRGGKIDPRVSNAVSQLAGSFLRAIELGSLEERVAALEKQRMGGNRHESAQPN